jgi:hypothetical protein
MKKSAYRLFVVAAVFAVTSLSAQSAFAATPTPRPGWAGTEAQAQAGPSGVSVKNNTSISISNVVNAVAQGGATLVVNVYTTVYNSVFSH